MPELPEVETIRRTLEKLIKNETIESVEVHWPKIIKRPDDVHLFQTFVQNETVHSIGRKGKFLLFELDDYTLVSHLRMEGKYRVTDTEVPIDKHTHIIFHLKSGKDLRYNDVRKFGTMHLFNKGEALLYPPLNKLAPDPFEANYNYDDFKKRIQATERMIKAALLDQTLVAGLGNIYVDEVLFLSKIHPKRRGKTLTDDEIKLIFKYTKEVLETAVKAGGTTIRSYVDSQGEMGMFQQSLYAYGQTGKKCKHCTSPIEKIKVAGRGTHFCPQCQKEV